jgi:hypothetical protein
MLHPKVVEVLKRNGFRGPFELKSLPNEWMQSLKDVQGADENSQVMIAGDDVENDEWVMKVDNLGHGTYAYGQEDGYQIGKAEAAIRGFDESLEEGANTLFAVKVVDPKTGNEKTMEISALTAAEAKSKVAGKWVEVDGEKKHYKFTDVEFFSDNILDFYEIDEFNGWKYGTLIEDFENANLFIMTPRGVNNIRPKDRENCFVIFIDPDKETIRERLLQRRDADSADRRIEADDKDFFEFSNYDMRVTNHDF